MGRAHAGTRRGQGHRLLTTTARQDPHVIQARPSLIAAARNADLVVCTGAELETGWLPILLRQSGNAKIQPGTPGYFEAADFVPKLEVPARLDRSAGDVHPGGNPHIQSDPRNIARVATALSGRLAELDRDNAAFYQARYAEFSKRWSAAIENWQKKAAPLRGVPVVVQHKAFPYLEQWLGLVQVAALSQAWRGTQQRLPLRSVDPAAEAARAHGAACGLQRWAPSEWLAERARIPVVVLPSTVGGDELAKDLFGLFDDTVARLLEGLK